MSIGFACLALGVFHSDYRTMRLDNISEDKLKEIIVYNIESLNKIIDYNIDNEISLFRISSDIIPFGSSPLNELKWWEIYKKEFQTIGKKIKDKKIRVSMHPGQYSVLNSPKEEVVQRTIDDLSYHSLVLDSLETDYTSKIVLHIGGVYGDKKEAIKRFICNYQKLPISVKRRLIIENDDRNYNIEEVLQISKALSIPVVFDNLHHNINPPKIVLLDNEWINLCKQTWKINDGKQKVHYSEQDKMKQIGSHSFTIDHNLFIEWYDKLEQKDIDIMLEVKDKNVSAIKIRNCINSKKQYLKKEWKKYKFKVLEHDPQTYEAIKYLIEENKDIESKDFYSLIDECLKQDLTLYNQIRAINEVWSSLSKDNEINKFIKRLEKVKSGSASVKSIKNYLYNLALKQENYDLISSYYFAF